LDLGGFALFRTGLITVIAILIAAPLVPADPVHQRCFRTWNLEEAVLILNNSPWARRETYTRVVGGIGSGVFGEKEIYNTFFVRLLSARPIREAYARVRQIHDGYDLLSEEEKKRSDASVQPGLELDVRRWIVVAVSFRSNDPNAERNVRQFLESQNSETMRNRVSLSTARFPQLHPTAYFPPKGDGIGAKFIFPREVNGIPVVTSADRQLRFELDIAGLQNGLSVRFSIPDMVVNGELVL
jgi:hypothetical protein